MTTLDRDPAEITCAPGPTAGVAHPVRGPGYEARVFLGSVLGDTSPAPTATPVLGAELTLDAGARVALDVDDRLELAVGDEPPIPAPELPRVRLRDRR